MRSLYHRLFAVLNGTITAGVVAKARDLCISIAVVLIVVPVALGVAFREQLPLISALVVIGIVLIFVEEKWLQRVEEKKARSQWKDPDQRHDPDLDAMLERATVKLYVLTPARLDILAQRGVDTFVISELGAIAWASQRVIQGAEFIPDVQKRLGESLFYDHIGEILSVHDASKSLRDLSATAKSPAPSPPSPPA